MHEWAGGGDLARKPAEMESLEDLSVDGRIILKDVKGIRWEKEQ